MEPSADMNPILLKPASDTGSQVIVNGQVLGTMSAREYFAYKKQLVPQIQAALARLDEAYDILVLEGAGSPAEINLREGDIVNMGMARMARSPVLLAGDIDRGGVFAQLLGTLQLLEPEEREMVKGLIINKFRGDKTILDPGVAELTRRAKVPVLGVVPFLDVEIEEEDSLARRLERQEGDGLLDIAVIRLAQDLQFHGFPDPGEPAGDLPSLCEESGPAGTAGSHPLAGIQEYHGRSGLAQRKRPGGPDPEAEPEAR